ncbi:unnamed protein product, partial [marine sediment metagenome]
GISSLDMTIQADGEINVVSVSAPTDFTEVKNEIGSS